MPPIRNYKDHDWTNFELHTMLCLIAKGVHLEERGKRTDAPNAAKNNAYLTFATKLNDAVHGSDYENDIHKKEVTRMLDHVLLLHKGVVGKGGLAERQFGGRITRGLKWAWERSRLSPIDYDGSISEWNQWRREKERQKHRVKLGLPPIEAVESAGDEQDGADAGSSSRANCSPQAQKPPSRNRWRSRFNALSSEYVDEAYQGKIPAIASDKVVQTNLDSFRTLPANLRSLSKYQWANPDAHQSAFLSGRGGHAAITAFPTDSYHPGVESSQDLGEYSDRGNSSRSRPNYNAYLPPINTRFSGSDERHSGYSSGMSAAKSRAGSDSTPGLTHDYSSSDSVDVSSHIPNARSGFNPRIQPSGSMTPLDLNHGHIDALAKGLVSEITTKAVVSVPISSTKVAGGRDNVNMGDLEEGEI